ncbi:MAG: hypothetical protein QXL51_06225 [Candidatus Aenigmatarchaeota archaeon]
MSEEEIAKEMINNSLKVVRILQANNVTFNELRDTSLMALAFWLSTISREERREFLDTIYEYILSLDRDEER